MFEQARGLWLTQAPRLVHPCDCITVLPPRQEGGWRIPFSPSSGGLCQGHFPLALMPHSLPRVLVTQFSEKSSYKATAPTDLQKLVAEPQARVCAQFCRDASLKSFVKHTAATAFPKAHHCLSVFVSALQHKRHEKNPQLMADNDRDLQLLNICRLQPSKMTALM